MNMDWMSTVKPGTKEDKQCGTTEEMKLWQYVPLDWGGPAVQCETFGQMPKQVCPPPKFPETPSPLSLEAEVNWERYINGI